MNTPLRKKRVVIIGGGFAGLRAAHELEGEERISLTLIDEKNHHLFQPLLYQVATAGLNPSDIAVPIRAQFTGSKNVEIKMDTVESVNWETHRVQLKNHNSIDFDYLIVACGVQQSYFGKNEWETFAPGLKTVDQATEIRRRILSAFEFAENETDPLLQKVLLTFVIVGGGPTGVELAGAIADISRTVLVRDFRNIDPSKAHIILIEAGPRILEAFHPSLSTQANHDLHDLGVEIRLNTRVERIDEEGVSFGQETIKSKTVLWAAGVRAGKLSPTLGVALDRIGRIKVNDDLSIPSHPEGFAVGDIAAFEVAEGQTLPGLASVATQAGRDAAHNILRDLNNEPRKKFVYHNKGQMATIGKHKAVVEIGKLRFSGYPAWILWLFVHILFLVGFRNRIFVLMEWIWNYLFSKRGSRLITSWDWKTSDR